MPGKNGYRGLGAGIARASSHALAAQEDAYWIANRFTNDVQKMSACGEVLLKKNLGGAPGRSFRRLAGAVETETIIRLERLAAGPTRGTSLVS